MKSCIEKRVSKVVGFSTRVSLENGVSIAYGREGLKVCARVCDASPRAFSNDEDGLFNDGGGFTICEFAIRRRWQQNNIAIKKRSIGYDFVALQSRRRGAKFRGRKAL
ncbi:MAG TPA: hypothetical protein VF666_07435 [Pyrinomonadaceae bacterium]